MIEWHKILTELMGFGKRRRSCAVIRRFFPCSQKRNQWDNDYEKYCNESESIEIRQVISLLVDGTAYKSIRL
jgi:hypothetical protein